MALKLFNVLTGKKEEFIPQEVGKVKMYACGITVSDNAHIGHAYQAIIFDIIRKYLRFIGYDVTYVRNYTDVDDKIIINAKKENISPLELAERLIKKTNYELEALDIEAPDIQARATECIKEIIEFIEKLIQKGNAYVSEDGSVYFKVSSFNNYGSFSNRTIDESLIGVRKAIEPGKENDIDFALWKSASIDEISWDSPWGKGRPGWHIECSTMSMKYLGETLDIHGGGKDLKFPHHENEITQSESLTGKQFAKYWLHNGLVKINGQKMSKSLGNGILIQDLIKKYNSDVIKITLLQNNYRSDLNIMDGMFENSEKKIYLTYKTFDNLDDLSKDIKTNIESKYYNKIKEEFINAMDNDFNTSLAINVAFNYINEMRNKIDNTKEIEDAIDIKNALISIYKSLGLFQKNPKEVISQIKDKYMLMNSITEEEVLELINKRKEFKKIKDYNSADNVRSELLKRGILINDTRNGTDWDISFQ